MQRLVGRQLGREHTHSACWPVDTQGRLPGSSASASARAHASDREYLECGRDDAQLASHGAHIHDASASC